MDHCNVLSSHACNRSCEPSTSTARCASSNDFLDRLDPPLPRFANNHSNNRSAVSGPQLILETRPTLPQSYRDEPLDASVEPSRPGNGDIPRQLRNLSDGQEVDIKRNRRASPSYLSVSQSRRAMATGAVLQVASSPLQTKELKGPTGLYVGFATMILGLMAVLQKGGLLGNSNAPTTICTSCNGYGRRVCNLCKGRGSVTWEGKLTRTDLCPSCLGSRVKKCSDCGGHRMRNDAPPFAQQSFKGRTSRP